MSNLDLTPEQVKAARALLAWSQQELATAARVSPSTVADFERGSRTPVPNNAQAMREALEGRGLQFVAGGVVEKTQFAPPPSLRPGALMRWINATDLAQWGERRDAQARMPEVVRRLIYAELGPAATVRFPADDSVQTPGYDGLCVTASATDVVPGGQSVWEIGAQRSGLKGKADADYAKRVADPLGVDPAQATFVFVTPQRFASKDKWVKAKRAEGPWRDVRVIDADDLVHWLETRPAVAQWLAVQIGRRPKGLRNLEEAWAEWSLATQPALTEDLILTDRDEDATAILKWIKGPPSLHAVQAEAPDEAVGFLYAAISPLPLPYRLSYWSRCVYAPDDETARQLVGIGSPLFVVLTDPTAGLAQRLVDDGHHVYAAYGPDAGTPSLGRRLARPWRYSLQKALERSGLAEEAAHRLARGAGRSVTVLRRLMPSAPNFRPKWAEAASPDLLAAMLAGSWVETSPADRRIISALAGKPYEEVEAVLAPLASTLDGPLLRSGEVWRIVSLRDIWSMLAAQLTRTQVERFEATFHQVLSTVNPRFEHDPKDLWIERPNQFGEEVSPALRFGLAEAMIAFGVYPDTVTGVSDTHHADRAVAKLLASAGPTLWWSLSRDFQRLAEASPRSFLEAVEAGLDGDTPAIMSLFRSDEGMMFPTEYLSNLLWALEMLARSPEFLPRAALLLARLDELDPGGRIANRPAASLRRIFVTWNPETYGTPKERLKVIDAIVRSYPRSGWKLLVDLAPKFHDTTDPSPHPDWRDFTPERREEITWASVGQAARDIGERLLQQVGEHGARWRMLLDLWANFEPAWRERAITVLAEYAAGLRDAAEIERLRDAIRDLVHQHRNFVDADWAMAEEDVRALEVIFEDLPEGGVAERHRWLFQSNPYTMRKDLSYQDAEALHEDEQRAAAEDLVRALSPRELVAFAETIRLQAALGAAIARAGIEETVRRELIKVFVTEPGDVGADISRGLLWVLAQSEGPEWLDELWNTVVDEGWGQTAENRLVLIMPAAPATWDRVANRSAALDRAYWSMVAPFRVDDGVDPERVAAKLMEAGRSRDALAWFGQNLKRNPPGALLVRVLRAAAKESPPTDSNGAVMTSHYVGLILDYLEKDASVSQDEVVSLEWTYFQVLRHSPRPPRLLNGALARDPKFFVQLVRAIYLPEKDSGVEEPPIEDLEMARGVASQAWNVLHDWKRVPGSDESGVIDGAALEDWVKEARKLLSEGGRGEAGDKVIGEILSAAGRRPGEAWPPEPVRDVIEFVRSRPLERGFEIGVYNGRGVTVRMPHDGGGLERDLAENFRRDADALRFDWSRTAACLERIAETYAADARREDQSAEQRDWS